MRKPLQGTYNIIRFNWHLYLLSIGLMLGLYMLTLLAGPVLGLFIQSLLWLIVLSTVVSLAVSFYVYDVSSLYRLEWLKEFGKERMLIVNIHAGFDETSTLLKRRFEASDLTVLDFYDPEKHTEASIRRARKAYPPFPHTQRVQATNLPLTEDTADIVFVFFSAHEIRDSVERTAFFTELHRILKPGGRIVVTEHLRDVPNFLAYTIGFLHFYSKPVWHKVFRLSKLRVQKEFKVTPFVSSFVLIKNGASY